MPPETAVVWWELLDDMDFDDAKRALKAYAQSERFPPTIADIRDGVGSLSEQRIEERLRLEQQAYFAEEPELDEEQRQKLIEQSRMMLKRLA